MLKWGILGTGRIAHKVVPLIQISSSHSFVAVASRSADRSVEFADAHKIKHALGSYSELIHHPEVEAIYLTTPNSTHFEWAKKALLAGKHVLCEKPLTMTFTEAAELQSLAREQNKHLAEGFMYRHHEQTLNILKLLHSKAMGEILHVQGGFHFHLSDPTNIRLQKTGGGGALRDVGSYLINFLTAIFEEDPQKICSTGILNNEGIDIQASSYFIYSEGRSAGFSCSFSAPRRNSVEIICEKGHLLIDNPFKPELSSGTTLITTGETIQHHWPDNQTSFMKQFDNFRDVIKFDARPTVPLQQSCQNQKLLDVIIQQLESDSVTNSILARP